MPRPVKINACRLLQHGFWKHLLTFLVGHNDLDDRRLSSAFKRGVIIIDVGWQEEFGVEEESLERREVGDL